MTACFLREELALICSMKQQALWMRLRETDWAQYEVSQGSAERLEKVLQDLASRKRARSMKACHEVWKLLCSKKVHSAAVVAVPFLVEIFNISAEETQAEICDVLKSCALGCEAVEEGLQAELKLVLVAASEKLAKCRVRGDLEIAHVQAMSAIADL